MPVFPDPNGGSMTVANEAEARARGWSPSMGSFGVNSYPTGGGGGGGGGGAAVPQVASGVSLDPASLQALTSFGNAAGTATAADLAERKRQFDLNLEWQKQQWTNQGLPQLVIQQRAQALQEQEFQFQMQMANQNMALQTAGVTGTFNGQPTEAARQFNLGMASDVLKTQASLSGPANYVQAANYARGISNTDIPAFMSSLLGGTPTTATAGGVGLSAPQSVFNLAGQAGAGGGNAGDLGGTLAMGRRLFGAGGGALGPQALEGLSPTEQAMLGSVGGAVGADVPGFMNAYARSRIGQQASQAG